jgi:hypothetical protein
MPDEAIPAGVSVSALFPAHIARRVPRASSRPDPSLPGGRDITLQYDVGGMRWCYRIREGEGVEVVEGGMDRPLVSLAVAEHDVKSAAAGTFPGVVDQLFDPMCIAGEGAVSTLLSCRGALEMRLKKRDGTVIPLRMEFNGEAAPAVSVTLDLDDWVSMLNGETSGQALFMSGRLTFTGDMVLVMKLQNLL